MNGYEKLITLIRNEIERKSVGLRIGTMASDTECRIGEIVLSKDDLYIAENLVGNYEINASLNNGLAYIGAHDTIQTVRMQEQPIKINHSLHTGDAVLVYRLSEEKYVIIAKVVTL